MFLCQTHDFVESLPAVILAPSIDFLVPNMAVRGDEDANRVCAFTSSACGHVLFPSDTYHAAGRVLVAAW
jgi:hypothetical protein